MHLYIKKTDKSTIYNIDFYYHIIFLFCLLKIVISSMSSEIPTFSLSKNHCALSAHITEACWDRSWFSMGEIWPKPKNMGLLCNSLDEPYSSERRRKRGRMWVRGQREPREWVSGYSKRQYSWLISTHTHTHTHSQFQTNFLESTSSIARVSCVIDCEDD